MLTRREEWLTKRIDELERKSQDAKDELQQAFRRAMFLANTSGLTPEWYAVKETIVTLEHVYHKFNNELVKNTAELRRLRREKASVS